VIQYTTPVVPLVIEGADITGADRIVVSFRQVIGRATNSHEVDVDMTGKAALVSGDTYMQVPLTQEQTGGFASGQVQVQVNWWTGEHRGATDIVTVPSLANLFDREEGVTA
jgi:hypothetical protein